MNARQQFVEGERLDDVVVGPRLEPGDDVGLIGAPGQQDDVHMGARRVPHHQRQLMANLAIGLFEHGGITTTVTRAKALRPYAEKLITKGKKGGVHRQRQVVALIHDQAVTSKLFTEIAPTYHDRNGGYTRILKLGPRPGDQAPMARIELV